MQGLEVGAQHKVQDQQKFMLILYLDKIVQTCPDSDRQRVGRRNYSRYSRYHRFTVKTDRNIQILKLHQGPQELTQKAINAKANEQKPVDW